MGRLGRAVQRESRGTSTSAVALRGSSAAMAQVRTSSAAHAGPLSLAAVAVLLGQHQLPEDTLLWAEHADGKLGPKLLLQNIVDVGDAGDVGDDEDGLEELGELLEATLLAEPEPEPELYTAEELGAIEATRQALRADGVADEMIGEAMLVVTVMNCVSAT